MTTERIGKSKYSQNAWTRLLFKFTRAAIGLKTGVQIIFQDTFGAAGLLLVVLFIFMAIIGPWIAPFGAFEVAYVKSEGRSTLAEEMPEAYKNVSEVVDVVHNAGISRKVAKLKPLGVIKG